MSPPLALGLDFGTSGARVAVVNPARDVVFQAHNSYSSGQAAVPLEWSRCLESLLAAVPLALRQRVGAMACDGTSSTVLLCSDQGAPLVRPLMYGDARGAAMVPTIALAAPRHHPVLSATSTLAKVLWWRTTLGQDRWQQAAAIVHQADWIAYLLHGRLGHSDYHNSLKLGYDSQALAYPPWLLELGITEKLPQVWAPGAVVGALRPSWVQQFQFPASCQVCAGTTDSNAAVLASGALHPGDGVTSLGSTLVIKLISPKPIVDGDRGVYSHRFGDRWLAGGASNTGGAVLAHYFNSAELAHLSQSIDPTQPSPLDYYPLLRSGERFPINDPGLAPRLSPRPKKPQDFLHGMLESMARIEQHGYACLHSLGAPALRQAFTVGGGAQNPTWTAIRERHLNCPVRPAQHTEAAVGAAYLALTSMG